MSTLEKLKQKRQQRQAAESSLEELLVSGGAGSSTATPAVPSVSKSVAAGATTAREGAASSSSQSARLPAKRAAPELAAPLRLPQPAQLSSKPAIDGQLPAFAPDRCPSSLADLQACVLRFICSSSLGPLPISGVGVNAALRREYMRAGQPRASLAVFRSADTAQAIRSVYRELQVIGYAIALTLEDAADEEDVLIADADFVMIHRTLSGRTLSAPSSSSKRARHSFSSNGAAGTQLALVVPGALVPYAGGVESRPNGDPSALQIVPVSDNGSSGTPRILENVEDLLQAPTARQQGRMDAGQDLRMLLAAPTARQNATAQKFMNKHQNMAQFCPHGSRHDCRRAIDKLAACAKIHFKKIIKSWTDESLGDCSYLDTCRHIDKCKYVHYALDLTADQAQYLNAAGVQNRGTDTKRINEMQMTGIDVPAQWIQCDLKKFPFHIFRDKVSVVMADPPWDIHMELPYGTLTDDEVRSLKVGDVCQDGVIFLWVTGRAMELARECLKIWGYRRVEEIIWVKTNQLQRIIRTGRTGHWINHAKEHCLVGIKGNPRLNRNLDCDVIVSEVRETSRKPDEIYNVIERMFPNVLKLELFGRPHNVHDNWITCGNQLDGARISEEEICRRYNEEFPNERINVFKRNREEVIPMFSDPKANSAFTSGSTNASSTAPQEKTEPEDKPWVPPQAAPSADPVGPAP